ncbi:MAG TPA: hypothetical protein VF652_01915 [Allosphingosinicella sp.]|jgi:hypothetical protein
MYEQNQRVATVKGAERAQWKCPELRRLAAGQAETAFTMGSDGATQS